MVTFPLFFSFFCDTTDSLPLPYPRLKTGRIKPHLCPILQYSTVTEGIVGWGVGWGGGGGGGGSV